MNYNQLSRIKVTGQRTVRSKCSEKGAIKNDRAQSCIADVCT